MEQLESKWSLLTQILYGALQGNECETLKGEWGSM